MANESRVFDATRLDWRSPLLLKFPLCEFAVFKLANGKSSKWLVLKIECTDELILEINWSKLKFFIGIILNYWQFCLMIDVNFEARISPVISLDKIGIKKANFYL
jgi:hypothetical protein